MVESRSPLAERLTAGGRDGADGKRGVRFTEIRGRHIVQLGVFGGGASAVSPLVRAITGAALPDSNWEVTESGPQRLFRIAADQFWVVSLEEGAGRALEQAMPPDSALRSWPGREPPRRDGVTAVLKPSLAASLSRASVWAESWEAARPISSRASAIMTMHPPEPVMTAI